MKISLNKIYLLLYLALTIFGFLGAKQEHIPDLIVAFIGYLIPFIALQYEKINLSIIWITIFSVLIHPLASYSIFLFFTWILWTELLIARQRKIGFALLLSSLFLHILSEFIYQSRSDFWWNYTITIVYCFIIPAAVGYLHYRVVKQFSLRNWQEQIALDRIYVRDLGTNGSSILNPAPVLIQREQIINRPDYNSLKRFGTRVILQHNPVAAQSPRQQLLSNYLQSRTVVHLLTGKHLKGPLRVNQQETSKTFSLQLCWYCHTTDATVVEDFADLASLILNTGGDFQINKNGNQITITVHIPSKDQDL